MSLRPLEAFPLPWPDCLNPSLSLQLHPKLWRDEGLSAYSKIIFAIMVRVCRRTGRSLYLLDWDAGIDGDPGDQYGRALTELVDRGMIYWALPPAHNVILINECLMHGDIGYREYLRSDWWRAQVIYARERAGNRCQLCNDGQALSVHHRTYERLGYEAEQDLIVLCRACHAKFHDKLPAHPDGGRSNAQEQA